VLCNFLPEACRQTDRQTDIRMYITTRPRNKGDFAALPVLAVCVCVYIYIYTPYLVTSKVILTNMLQFRAVAARNDQKFLMLGETAFA
jgi:type II secretory pathway component PulM